MTSTYCARKKTVSYGTGLNDKGYIFSFLFKLGLHWNLSVYRLHSISNIHWAISEKNCTFHVEEVIFGRSNPLDFCRNFSDPLWIFRLFLMDPLDFSRNLIDPLGFSKFFEGYPPGRKIRPPQHRGYGRFLE